MSDQVIFGGSAGEAQLIGSSDRRHSIQGEGNWDSTENMSLPCPIAGTFKDFVVYLGTAPGASKSYAIGLYVDDVLSDLEVTIADSATDSSDSDEVHVNQGQLVELKSIPANTPATTAVTWYMTFVPDDGESSINLSWVNNATNNAADRYHPPQGGGNSEQAAIERGSVRWAVDGTIKNFYVRNQVSPGAAPNSYTRTIYVDGSPTSLQVVLEDPDNVDSDLVNTASVTAGELVTIHQVTNSSPTFCEYGFSFAFTPTTEGESCICGVPTNSNPDDTGKRWVPFGGVEWNGIETTELQAQQRSATQTIKNWYMELDAAPGAGKQYRFRSRINGSYGNLDITISGASTSGSDLVNEDVLSDNDLFCYEVEPINTPNATGVFLESGVVGFLAPAAPPGQGPAIDEYEIAAASIDWIDNVAWGDIDTIDSIG